VTGAAWPEPPGNVPVRTTDVDGTTAIWVQAVPGLWIELGDEYAQSARWDDIAAGGHGRVDLLIPVPYTARHATDPAAVPVATLVEAVLDPAAAMMQQLARAAGAGVIAVVGEAYDRGRRDQATTGEGDPGA
jgi:hypothetical protein